MTRAARRREKNPAARAAPRRPTDFGCDGCNNTWPWLLDADGTVYIHHGRRQHISPNGDLVPCENPALAKVDDRLWARRWLR
jgi:hypothetical protein